MVALQLPYRGNPVSREEANGVRRPNHQPVLVADALPGPQIGSLR